MKSKSETGTHRIPFLMRLITDRARTLFAEKAEAGAKLEGITFTNCKLEIGTVISSDQGFFDCTEFIGVDEGAQITDCDTAYSGGITITGDPRN